MNKATLVAHCAEMGSHHLAMCKLEKARAAKCQDTEMADYHTNAADLHEAAAARWIEFAKGCREGLNFENDDSVGAQDVLENAARVELFGMTAAVAKEKGLNKLVPTAARGVMPSDVPAGLTLVGRPGGPPINKATVPAEFADLVGE